MNHAGMRIVVKSWGKAKLGRWTVGYDRNSDRCEDLVRFEIPVRGRMRKNRTEKMEETTRRRCENE